MLINTSKSTITLENKAAMPQRSRTSIKKAYVRFDDYLDLNEESMRRSCKRIMKKLYCEPGNSNNSDQTAEMLQPAETNDFRPVSPPPPNQQFEPESANKLDAIGRDDHSNDSATIVSRSSGSSLTSSESTEPVQLNEKSYLRSQYERRQKRQFELMNKMQRAQSAQQQLQQHQQQHESSQIVTKLNLIGSAKKFNQDDNNDTDNINGGADKSICRKQQLRHQQDLVAKSHELSKRRFFEQLERRESVKKESNLSTQNSAQSRGTIFKQVQHQHPQQSQLQQQQQQQGQNIFPSDAKIGEMNGDDTAGPYYKQHLLVGPDQAYPNKNGRLLLVENHGYASIVNLCQIEPVYSRSARNDEQSVEFISSEQYANLPNGIVEPQYQQPSAIVEYATVRASSQRGRIEGNGDGIRIPPAENKTHSTLEDDNRRTSAASSEVDSESSLSSHNRSMSSANSGGFLTLPPVRLIDHNGFANNFHSNQSHASLSTLNVVSPIQSNHMRKPSSLLKRFGSLVSRAFTLNNGGAGDLASLQSPQRSRVCDKAFVKPPLKQPLNFTENCEVIGAQFSMTSQFSKEVDTVDSPATENHSGNEIIAKNSSKGENITVVNCGEVINLCGVTDKGDQATSGAHEPKVAEVDLVILPTKHTKNNLSNPQYQSRKSPADQYEGGAACCHIYGTTGSQKDQHRRVLRHNDKLSRPRHLSRDKIRTTDKINIAHGRRLSPTISISSHSLSLKSSLEYSFLTSSSDLQEAGTKTKPTRITSNRKSQLKRASSLSDELESLMSPSEAENSINTCSLKISGTKSSQPGHMLAHDNKVSSNRISIDCGSPLPPPSKDHDAKKAQSDNLNSKSRSLLRWFGSTNSSVSLSPRAADQSIMADCIGVHSNLKCVIKKNDSGAPKHADGRHHSMNGFLSLIDGNHANSDHKLDRVCKTTTNLSKKSNSNKLVHEYQIKESTSLIYSGASHRNRVPPPKTGLARILARTATNECRSDDSGENSKPADRALNDDKCKSLNIYQSISRNYTKRHHHRRHRHVCGHHNHHHRCHRQNSSSPRHARCSMPLKNRCGQDCSSPQTARLCPESCSSCSSDGKADAGRHCGNKASVWGQLVKINKSDGSQVIELQRAPNKSWGFFVARGAINNVKGIFISRMHDDLTSSSLSGLLSIGDRILAIDDFHIEPDFDILRVNQMISKKSKILLKVKPFKG